MRGGESAEYQGRKKRTTTNALYLAGRQGIPLAMSEPVAGNHNDLFDIEVPFEKITTTSTGGSLLPRPWGKTNNKETCKESKGERGFQRKLALRGLAHPQNVKLMTSILSRTFVRTERRK